MITFRTVRRLGPRRPASAPHLALHSATAVIVVALASSTLAATAAPAASTAADTLLATFEGGTVAPHEFVRAWQTLMPDERPKGDLLEAKRTFLVRMVDRKLLAREAARLPLVLTAAQEAEIERARSQMIQNELFALLTADLPAPSPQDLETLRRQRSQIAEVRFITFPDWDTARSWRMRLTTGTPTSALDELIRRGGPTVPVADSFRWVAAEQIPDTLASVIWTMRPGQLSEVHSFAGHPVLIHLRGYERRPGAAQNEGAAVLSAEFQKKQYDRVRQRIRVELAEQIDRRFVDEGMNVLLAGYLKLPPRSDVDTLTGTPVLRANLPLPVFTAADTGHVLARTRNGELNLVSYLRYWGRVPGFARPEVRERAILEATVDRILLETELVRLGVERGLDQNPRVLAELERMREGYSLDHWHAAQIDSRIHVDEAALERHFRSQPGHYDDPATLQASIILVDRQDLADSLLAALRQGASFPELALAFSIDGRTAAGGGKTGIVARGTNTNVELEEAMFATPVGALGGPVRTPEGWTLWRIESKEPGKQRTFAEAREWVDRDYRILEGERVLKERLTELRKKANVKIFAERVTRDLGAGGDWGD